MAVKPRPTGLRLSIATPDTNAATPACARSSATGEVGGWLAAVSPAAACRGARPAQQQHACELGRGSVRASSACCEPGLCLGRWNLRWSVQRALGLTETSSFFFLYFFLTRRDLIFDALFFLRNCHIES